MTFSAPGSGPSGVFADSGTYTATMQADGPGYATSPLFSANALTGTYVVSATVQVVVTPTLFQVTNGGWYVSPSGDDGDNCRTPLTPCAGVNGALAKAGFVDGDTVLVASGYYTGTGPQVVLLDRSARLIGGWDGGFTTQSGTSIFAGQGARRGMTVDDGVTAIVERFGFREGHQTDGSGSHNSGDLTLFDTVIISSTAAEDGGGIYNANTGSLTIYNGVILSNTNTYGGGGIRNLEVLNVYDIRIAFNVSGYGGGIQSGDYGEGLVTIEGCTIEHNRASSGGGIHNSAVMTVNSSALLNNDATNGGGGGIDNSSGTLYLNNSTISGNTAYYWGSASPTWVARTFITAPSVTTTAASASTVRCGVG